MAPTPALEALLRSLRETSRDSTSPERAREEQAFGRAARAVACGWPTIDEAMDADGGAPGLVRGGVHEWFGVGPVRDRRTEDWTPPLLLLTHVARRAARDAAERGAPDTVVWIGRRVWPYPRALTDAAEVVETGHGPSASGELELELALKESPDARAAEGGDLFRRSLFVDPPDASLRLWAIDTALRCGGVTAVVADGSGLGMAATRRLQLAAAAADTLVLTARPPYEVREVSAATTRWTIARAPDPARHPPGARDDDAADGPRWTATLLRAKGAQNLRRDRLGAAEAHRGIDQRHVG